MANFTNETGFLDVGEGHEIYWEDWGNKHGVPVIRLHGGPGSGMGESATKLFDPYKHHVLLHDQRGSGKSTPFASTENNTTQHLVNDIELLRKQAGFDKAHVVGGSWGSTLALAYSIEHPQAVKSLLMWGIYLARPFEDDWVNEGYPRFNFPTEWERFISHVPQEHRGDGKGVLNYYASKIRSQDPDEAKKYAIEWTLWESCLCSVEYDPEENEKEIVDDPSTVAVAMLETHYFLKGCFMPRDHILKNIAKIGHVPCKVIQGRFDMCTPPISAHDLKQAYGDKMSLQMINGGHSSTDKLMFNALKKAVASLK